jgi:hypothetical protein
MKGIQPTRLNALFILPRRGLNKSAQGRAQRRAGVVKAVVALALKGRNTRTLYRPFRAWRLGFDQTQGGAALCPGLNCCRTFGAKCQRADQNVAFPRSQALPGNALPRGTASQRVVAYKFTHRRQSLQDRAFPGRAWERDREVISPGLLSADPALSRETLPANTCGNSGAVICRKRCARPKNRGRKRSSWFMIETCSVADSVPSRQ